MKLRVFLTNCLVLASATVSLTAQSFYGDPPDEHHPWAVHDANRPQPTRVEPGSAPGQPPSDAIVLFNGSEADLAKWESDKGEPTKWLVKDGALECVPKAGYIQSKQHFGDCQLHVEWAAPSKVEGESQGRGNSGVFLMGEVEVQVLDNYNNPTYPDGFAGSVYGINPPMANPLNAPGEWQSYDIIFRRPVFKDGQEIHPGYLTVFVNGVLVQDHTPLEGGGGHRNRSKSHPFVEKGPLKLQDHGNPVRYRNIWFRPLPARSIEGGTDGRLTKEAAMAKRAEIAAEIRQDAATKSGKEKMFRLLESLVYAENTETLKEGTDMMTEYAAALKATPTDQMEDKKKEIMRAREVANYLVKHGRVSSDFPAKPVLDAIVKEQEWDKKKE